MATLSRMSGGMPPKLPFGLDQWIYSTPYLVLMLLSINIFTFKIVGIVLVCWVLAMLGKRQANRVFMDLGSWAEEVRKPHKYEVVIGFLKPKISNYWYDFIGLTLLGLATVLAPGIFIITQGHLIAGLILLISGSLKGVSYAVGKILIPNGFNRWLRDSKYFKHVHEDTQVGELLTGFFAGIGVVISWMYL